MTLADDLAGLPGDALIPVSWIRDRIGETAEEDRISDLTVSEVAAELGRQPSTVRGWLGSGDLDGYKLNGREWRVAPEALRAFMDDQRARGPSRGGGGGSRAADLSSWREEVAG